jgi:hypothetical protein
MATTCLAHYNDFAKSSTAPLSGGNRNCPPTMELGGWEASAAAQGLRRTFPSLSVAIAYAIDHGYTYRVVHVPNLVGSREAMPTLKFSHRGLEGRQHASTS